MRLNFKKVSAIAASALMVGMTMGVAAAASTTFPGPFVSGSTSNVAIVYGTGAGVSSLDLVQAGNIQSNLQSRMISTTGSSTASVSGEAVGLFGGSQKLYLNNSLNTVRTSATKADLPTLLADGTFSGNVNAKITQSLQIGNNPTVAYKAQPTTNDDPQYGVTYGTSVNAPLLNLTASFDKAVNFLDANSQGQTLRLFGMDFTVSSSSTASDLVLLQSAQKLDLTRDVSSGSAVSPNAVKDVTVAGKKYTIELVSGSSTASTIKVTDSTGATESKSITSATSKTVNGITVAVITATQAGNIVTSSIVAGANKVTLTNGNAVTLGDSNTAVLGTQVSFAAGTVGNVSSITGITVSFAAPDSDHDAITAGQTWTDPVFGTVSLQFPGVNYPEGAAGRENISVVNSGDDKMQVSFTDYRNNQVSQVFAKVISSLNPVGNGISLTADDSYHNITVMERGIVKAGGYVVVGNQDHGYLLKLQSTQNTSGAGAAFDGSKYAAQFVDVATGQTLQNVVWSSAGVGTLTTPDGNTYTVTMTGNSANSTDQRFVRLSYPDGSRGNANTAVLFPTIQTSQGAKIGFYQPTIINLSNWDGAGDVGGDGVMTGAGNNLTTLKLPNGNGYTSVTLTKTASLANTTWYVGSCQLVTNGSLAGAAGTLSGGMSGCAVTAGSLVYNITNTGIVGQLVTVYLMNPNTGLNISTPSLYLQEGKDYNGAYNAQVITLTNTSSGSTNYIGISAVRDTWSNGSSLYSGLSVHSNNKLTKAVDYYGTVVTQDTSDSNHRVAYLSYPKEQVYAQVYAAANSAVISAGVTAGGSAQLGDVLVKDSEVSSVSTKNLIVVGGSCINSVAASLLGGSACSADFTTKTGVGTGQFLIQSLASTYSTGKVALVVAGYEAADTANAEKYLTTQNVDTTVGKKYVGTTATTATLTTTSA
ncbi:Uncharacterised protein [uncultured archaeon]|nr:Uncharacterised protein [uncultured archaeon]